MKPWERLFADAANSGIHFCAKVSKEEIEQAAQNLGVAFFSLNLRSISGKDAFLNAAAKCLQFPDYFGGNWDAFEDCLTDLSWIESPGLVWLVEEVEEFSKAAPVLMATAREILERAAEYWKAQGIGFFVVMASENLESRLP